MRAGVPSARSSRLARTSGVGRHRRRTSRTSPGMSIHGAPVISCSISVIGNSGARSSGPTGSRVTGCNGGWSGSGSRGRALNHAVGIFSAARLKRITSLLSALSSGPSPGRRRRDPRPSRAPLLPERRGSRRRAIRAASAGPRTPDSATRHRTVGDEGRHPGCSALVHLERDQVPLVDTDQVRADGESPLELRLVVHLDERVEADVARQRGGARPAPAGSARRRSAGRSRRPSAGRRRRRERSP